MIMRVMRFCVAILTALVTVVFFVVLVTTKVKTDNTIPVITVEDGILEVSVNASDEELLAGVKATDEKDGDISDRLLVESIGRFTEKGYCKITYAVSDYDNHVATATRKIHYTDYSAPKFTLSRPLLFSIYETVDTTGIVGATDCLDGNISQNVIIYSPDFEEVKEGKFSLQANVTNSKGDASQIVLPMVVEKQAKGAPEIHLNKYLIYVKKGKAAPDWKKYIEETVDSTGLEADLTVEVKTNFDKDKPGIYTVDYYGTDSMKIKGHTVLIVVVE